MQREIEMKFYLQSIDRKILEFFLLSSDCKCASNKRDDREEKLKNAFWFQLYMKLKGGVYEIGSIAKV